MPSEETESQLTITEEDEEVVQVEEPEELPNPEVDIKPLMQIVKQTGGNRIGELTDQIAIMRKQSIATHINSLIAKCAKNAIMTALDDVTHLFSARF